MDMDFGFSLAGLLLAACVYWRGGHAIAGVKPRRSITVAVVAITAIAIAYAAGAGWWSLVAAGSAATFTLGHGTVLGFLDRGVDGRASGWAPFSTGVLTGMAFVTPLAVVLFTAGHGAAAAVLVLAGWLKAGCYALAGFAAPRPFGLPDRDALAGALHGASVGTAVALIPLL